MLNKFNAHERTLIKRKEEKEFRRRRELHKEQLKNEDKQQNVKRIQRMNEYKRYMLQRKLEEKASRTDELKFLKIQLK